MSTAEVLYDRGEFFAFARKRIQRPSRQPHPARNGGSSPSSPHGWGGIQVTRGQFIGGLLVATAAASLLKPWEWLAPAETLESLVAQAKNMEEQFKGQDLSDKTIRSKYVDILAGAFTLHTSPTLSRDEIEGSVLFGETPQDYIRLLNQHSLKPNPTDYNYIDDVAATTDKGKIVINLTHPIFHLKNMANPIYPKDWNPLKSLRRVLSHEFNHLVTPIIADQELFDATDLDARFQERRVAGFSIRAVHPNGSPIAVNVPIDEAAVEMQAANFSSLFGPSVAIQYFTIYGDDIAAITSRLSNLTKAAGIGLEQVSDLNRGSKLKEFLLLLAEKAKISPQATLVQKLEYGFKVCDALMNNDQKFLQDFITRSTLP